MQQPKQIRGSNWFLEQVTQVQGRLEDFSIFRASCESLGGTGRVKDRHETQTGLREVRAVSGA